MRALTWKKVLELPVNTFFRIEPKQNTTTGDLVFAEAVNTNKTFKKTGNPGIDGLERISCTAMNHVYKHNFYLKEFDLENLDIYLSNPQTRLEALIL